MKRLLLVAVVIAGGCRGQAPTTDPFLRTTVPPPGTGQGGAAQPYYSPGGSSSNGTSAPTAPAGGKYTPPGGSFNFQQTSTDETDAGLTAVDGATDAVSLAGHESANALGKQLAATIRDLHDPPPSFDGAPAGRSQVHSPESTSADSSVTLAAHTTSAGVLAESDPPPMPEGRTPAMRTADVRSTAATNPLRRQASTTTREVVETGHYEQTDADGGQSVIRIVGTKIVNEPRTDEGADGTGETASGTGELKVASTGWESSDSNPSEIADLPPAPAKKRGLMGQAYERPAQLANVPVTHVTALEPTGNDRAQTATTANSAMPEARPPSSAAAATPPTSRPSSNSSLFGPYSYDPAYHALHGRLEYSHTNREWKLRYIPIDGQTDQYGGSVVLTESPLLSSFKPGEMVAVRGVIPSGAASSRGFAPKYELHHIDRQAN